MTKLKVSEMSTFRRDAWNTDQLANIFGKRNIILVDPHVSGHHLSYIKIYATAFAELGCRVAILSPGKQVLKSYLSGLLEVHGDNIGIYEFCRRKVSSFELNSRRKQGRIGNLWDSLYSWLDFKDIAGAIKRNHLDSDSLIFVLWLDSYISKYLPAFFVDAVLPARFAGLYFHPGHLKVEERTDRNYRDLLSYLPLFKSRKLKFVGGFDKLLIDKLGSLYKGVKFVTLPDIAEKHVPNVSNELIKAILQKARNRKIVSLVGSLDPRKNVGRFFNAARECDANDIFFVCVGKLHAERFSEEELVLIRDTARECSDKIFFHENFIESDEVFDALFTISSVIFAAYVKFMSSSNMITKASLYGVPLIVSSGHLMGELVAKYDLGVCIQDCEAETIQKSIELIVTSRHEYGFQQFNNDNSYDNLKKELKSLI